MAQLPDRGPQARSTRICIVGWGAIAHRVVDLVRERGDGTATIVGIAVRDAGRMRDALPDGARMITSPRDLAGLGADLVLEAASREAVETWGKAALETGCDFAVSSTAAFADDETMIGLIDVATRHGGRILIPPGALGGLDALVAAAIAGLHGVEHVIAKPPRAWLGTPAEDQVDLDRIAERTVFFTGTARTAAAAFPSNANVAVITALAGVGLDSTRLSLVVDPSLTRNEHHVLADGAFGSFEIRMRNEPLLTNPKSSEMTALSLVRLIERRTATLIV